MHKPIVSSWYNSVFTKALSLSSFDHKALMLRVKTALVTVQRKPSYRALSALA